MKIPMKGGGKAAEADIAVLEAAIQQPLDSQFRRFISYQNGAIPDSNSFPVNGVDHMGGIDQFIAIKDIVNERDDISGLGVHAYPFAVCAGGNYVLLDQGREGAIFFWDHEIEGGIYKVADSLEAFLDMLEPFDTSKIKPAPGQVKSAWIDPDFLKQFGD